MSGGRRATLVFALLGLGCGAGIVVGSTPTTTVPADLAFARSALATPAPTRPATTSTSAPPTSTTSAPPPTTTSPPPPVPARRDGAILLVWTSGGLPAGFAADVTGLAEVRNASVVSGDLIRLTETLDADGAVVDRVVPGWAFPVDAFAVDPATYASFQPEPARHTLAELTPGQAVLTRTSAALRRVGVGATLRFVGGDVVVRGIVDDADGGGAEVIVHRDDAARLGIDDERFILLTDDDRTAVVQAIRSRTPAGEHLSVRSSAEAAWLRHGDRVQPQALVKRAFGEFTFRDRAGRDVEIDPGWVRRNIVTESVPILGPITCHRDIVPLVRAAMTELQQSGRAGTVDASTYAGCQYARRMAPGAALSRHSWGIALDLNVSSDPRGTFDSQDPALVDAMTRRGFDWGGQWEYPDPGHYELRSPG